MFLPPGFTEAEVTAALLEAAEAVGGLYTFGYHELEDAKQEAMCAAIENSLPKFDATRGTLVAFLATAMRHSLSNYKRKHYWRNEPPCRGCADGRTHDDGRHCEPHLAWIRLNTAKANLVHPLDIENLEDEPTRPDTATAAAVNEETASLIDTFLPADLRSDYLRLKAGLKLSKERRQAVLDAVLEALL